jgi:1-aminocyclopropane-1-carboxylate deaminase/D-cysteine desulfhydrase-like pyridoxal-dependent ACC family enzyme
VIGRYPTPLQRLPLLSTERCELWVKRDDLTNDVYGGSKVRKLEHILERARERSARRIVTFGAAGSHHVLATTLHGRRAGFEVAAILTPQHRTEHAMKNLRAALALRLQVIPASSMALAPIILPTILREGDFVVGPGGSTLHGTSGYVDAGFELARQIRDGAMPAPDLIVVALGSAGTAAGLLAGVAASKMESANGATEIVAVRVVSPVLMGRQRTLGLAFRVARYRKLALSWGKLAARLTMDPGFLGAGYGHATAAGDRATELALREGLALDQTYTAKTFAAALQRVESGGPACVLYWHTLSSAPLEPMLAHAPLLPPELDRLFVTD